MTFREKYIPFWVVGTYMAFLLLTCAIGKAFGATEPQKNPTEQQEFQKQLEAKYPQAKDSIVVRAFPGFWAVTQNGNVFYMSDDLSLLINGDVFDLNNRQSLTAKFQLQYPRKIDVGMLPHKDAIKISKGKRKLYVFSDPDCPHCRDLERELNKLQDAEIEIFELPLVELHSNAPVIAENIWCQPDKAQAWKTYMDSGNPPPASTCDNPIARNLMLAGTLQIRGTPAIIFEDGRIFPGTMTAEQINVIFNTVGKAK